MVARRRPVLAALRSRTGGQPPGYLLVDDVLAVEGLAGLGIDFDEESRKSDIVRKMLPRDLAADVVVVVAASYTRGRIPRRCFA
jgi:hypothetical protein